MTAERAGRRLVRERSRGVCEVCSRRRATNAHHRLNRSQGGTWDPANLLHLCGSGTTGCHGFITTHPAIARDRGWTLRRGQDPLGEPVLLARSGLVLLRPDGGTQYVPTSRQEAPRGR